MRVTANIAIANPPLAGKNRTFPAPNGQNWSGEILNHFAAAATNTSNCAQPLIKTANAIPMSPNRRKKNSAAMTMTPIPTN
jgi:hypothetical protein